MKLYKAGWILQMLYCVPCLLVVVCMLMYDGFYPTQLSEICFRIGAMSMVISTMNPLGLVGTVMRWIGCFRTDVKEKPWPLFLTMISPMLIVVSWMIAVYFFVEFSGGV